MPGLYDPRWYRDNLTGSASFNPFQYAEVKPDGPRMTLDDMERLRALDVPQVIALLELSQMPRLTEVALVAHTAIEAVRQENPNNPLLPALFDVEAKGHALARAAREHPTAAEFVATRVQRVRELLNVRAARAANGDAAALAELRSLAVQTAALPLAPAAFAAMNAYLGVQHRLRMQPNNLGFLTLRMLTFDSALERARGYVSGRRSLALGGASLRVTEDFCFTANAPAWDPAEITVHRKSCTSDGRAVARRSTPDDSVCRDAGLVPAFERLLALGVQDRSQDQMRRVRNATGLNELIGGSVEGAGIENTASSTPTPRFVCMVLFTPEMVERDEKGNIRRRWKEPNPPLAVPFVILRESAGSIRVRLDALMGAALLAPVEQRLVRGGP